MIDSLEDPHTVFKLFGSISISFLLGVELLKVDKNQKSIDVTNNIRKVHVLSHLCNNEFFFFQKIIFRNVLAMEYLIQHGKYTNTDYMFQAGGILFLFIVGIINCFSTAIHSYFSTDVKVATVFDSL